MNDAKRTYWEETVSNTISEHRPDILLSDAELTAIAGCFEIAAQMQAEAFGELNIPNPLITEQNRIRRCADEREKDLQHVVDIWRNALAGLMRVEPRRLYLNNGNIELL